MNASLFNDKYRLISLLRENQVLENKGEGVFPETQSNVLPNRALNCGENFSVLKAFIMDFYLLDPSL